MVGREKIRRRTVLTGGLRPQHNISSAVVFALPECRRAISARLAAMPGVEVHAQNESRIVITIEGSSSGQLGEALMQITLIEGVVSASMVFEHIEQQESDR